MNQELLYKYFKGITSVEEEKMILDWIDAPRMKTGTSS